MSKKIYWIDDNIQQMLNIVYGIVSKFWNLDSEEEGIAAKIIIFGNASITPGTKELWTELEEEEFIDNLYKIFKRKCRSVDATASENLTYKKNKALIEDSAKILFKKEIPEEEYEFYQKILRIWGKSDLEDANSGEYQSARKLVEQFIAKLEMEEESGVGIDLELIYGDIIENKVPKRILSMELYYQLKKQKYKCFLYSTRGDSEKVKNSWKEIYQKCYPDDEDDNITIFSRTDMMEKGNDKVIDNIEQIIKN